MRYIPYRGFIVQLQSAGTVLRLGFRLIVTSNRDNFRWKYLFRNYLFATIIRRQSMKLTDKVSSCPRIVLASLLPTLPCVHVSLLSFTIFSLFFYIAQIAAIYFLHANLNGRVLLRNKIFNGLQESVFRILWIWLGSLLKWPMVFKCIIFKVRKFRLLSSYLSQIIDWSQTQNNIRHDSIYGTCFLLVSIVGNHRRVLFLILTGFYGNFLNACKFILHK